ncbi:MAG: glycosyltransferase family 2 protein [Candidatus Hydrogenedentes bacterium]|nr:glycosyltransferase family 2 protein [Candidatus Hydrogenedentota bacterium]
MNLNASRTVSIVVPVFNEEESLPLLHEQVARTLAQMDGCTHELIYVDDGSSDGSLEVCRELYARDPEHVRVISFRRNFGQTAAMAAGFDAARGEVIIPMDADLQNDPNDIPRLLEKIKEGYDVVSGWRADRQDTFLSRRLPSVLANRLISAITGVHLHDYGCTLKAYHRDVAAHMNFYGELHRFLPVLASWAGARVAEIKVNHRARQFGVSKYGIGRTLRVLLDLITIKFLLSYSTKPMQVFGKWGLYALCVGFFAGLMTLGEKLLINQDVTDNAWLFVCMFFSLGGLQLICMGLLGEINVRTYYESQKKPIYTVRERLGGSPSP